MELIAEEVQTQEEEKFLGKIASIESGLYEDGEGKLKEYINTNYSNCRVCFVCESANYLKFSGMVKNFESESIFLLSDDLETKKHLGNVKDVITNVSLIVCLDNASVDFAKYVSEICEDECLFYFEKMPILDCFLPIRRREQSSMEMVSANAISHYIICYFPPNRLNRADLVESVFSCLSYLCLFLEKVINTILFNEKMSETNKTDFVDIVQRLNTFLHQIYFMPDGFLDNYLIFLEDFAYFLTTQGFELNSKENIFVNIFNHLSSKPELSLSEIRIVGAQAFCRLYYQFFASLDGLQLNYFDLQKKLQMLDECFAGVDFELENYAQIDLEQVAYLLNKHKGKISKRVQNFVKMLEQMLNSALDLYVDSGYAFSKKLNQDVALKAIYFTPDFLRSESLLKIIRDFGVLDCL